MLYSCLGLTSEHEVPLQLEDYVASNLPRVLPT